MKKIIYLYNNQYIRYIISNFSNNDVTQGKNSEIIINREV